tara:strand:+ start:683 stop:802 length:120 start_codon:yes stop_codon:yes gene_type:complete
MMNDGLGWWLLILITSAIIIILASIGMVTVLKWMGGYAF